jgi:prolyl-tRNA synthetase
VVISERGIKEGQFEYQHRRDKEASKVAIEQTLDFLRARLQG